jgi:PAS domain S-box-containing protein
MKARKEIENSKYRRDYHLMVIDEGGKILFANTHLSAVLHHEGRQFADSSIFDFLNPVNYESFKKTLQDSDNKDQKALVDLSLKNGTIHETRWEINKLLSSPASLPSYLCVGYDIRKDEFSEGVSKKNDDFFNSVLNKLDIGIIVRDGTGKVIHANQKASEILNSGLDNLDGKNSFEQIWKTLNPRDQSTIFKGFPPINTLQTRETHSNSKMVIETRGRESRSIRFHSQPLFDDQRSVPVAVVSCFFDAANSSAEAWDITDRYKADPRLQRVNEREFHLSRLNSDAMWEWNMETGQVFRNLALQNLAGFQQPNSRDLSWWFQSIHPKDRERVKKTIEVAIAEKSPSWSEEYEFESADGPYKYVASHGYIIYENGKPMRMIGSLKDISEVKELKILLEKQKLKYDREIAETAVAAQERERTYLGHELHDNVNQVLSSAKLYLDLLKPTTKNQRKIRDKASDFIFMAIEEIRDLSSHLVVPRLKGNGLLDSIGMVVEDINSTGLYKVKFTARNHIYVETLSENKKIAIFRIVQEQMNNIIKYSLAKNVSISLTKNAKGVQLDMHDDGIGFDINQTKKGIGLSNICDRSKLFNGSVDYQTSPGHGCALTVLFPAD